MTYRRYPRRRRRKPRRRRRTRRSMTVGRTKYGAGFGNTKLAATSYRPWKFNIPESFNTPEKVGAGIRRVADEIMTTSRNPAVAALGYGTLRAYRGWSSGRRRRTRRRIMF